ncbi:uncharacterized protein K489DRAFT_376005 [Dissoconium aciculare CBS 342.82]|uniref:Secreted protein n=1 Tax=Dissoconium aciculare CBS 342.82 TaxID=1314786 RepID=A0A6J3MIT9_9PEZI|nr:uncharacterized protein K489DRAFT_376005 [Dissoconium aciculare CBS 342.82]KAF1827836.1 hypothetical protein K489DRAFT_376005 [Dissoconium aciculare CBS 342.82]
MMMMLLLLLLLLLLMLVARSGCGHVRTCSVREGVRVWVVVVHCTAQCLGSLDQPAGSHQDRLSHPSPRFADSSQCTEV